jgi:hypothetical protein
MRCTVLMYVCLALQMQLQLTQIVLVLCSQKLRCSPLKSCIRHICRVCKNVTVRLPNLGQTSKLAQNFAHYID